jgi:hypothetical protein
VKDRDWFDRAELNLARAEIERVLAFGDGRHPNNAWKKKSLSGLMEHARGHEGLAMAGCPLDKDSKCHNLAHSIVRRMMALQRILDESERKGATPSGV